MFIRVCHSCGEAVSKGEEVWAEDLLFCESCGESVTVTCDHCGEQVLRDHGRGDSARFVCDCCYDNHYYSCCTCDRIIPADELYDHRGQNYCRDCYDDLENNEEVIFDYDYRPEPIFYDTEKSAHKRLFLGVELEIDCGGKDGYNAEKLLETANKTGDYLYIKSDGSLNDGMELVTHPMTLDFHLQQMPWAAVMELAQKMGYLSHKTSTCGLHVHVGREELGKDLQEQEFTIAKLMFLVEAHWNELLRFSRRTEANMNRWAARYGYKDSPQEILHEAKTLRCGRYAAVNITNASTIELRMFRGTLKYKTFCATLQLVQKLCEVAFSMSEKELHGLSWGEFVRGIPSSHTELVAYLKERNLYINDPVTEEDEI